MFNTRTYLDCAAGMSGNPSSPHTEGRRAKQVLEDARKEIARLIEVQPDDVIFTSGATEANALAILGVAAAGDHMLYLPSAHASIVENMKLVAERGVEIEALPITDGQVDCEKLKGMLRPETKLVSMDAVCGETGVIWNTREVADILHCVDARRPQQLWTPGVHKALLHVDASQAPLTEKITRAHFSADMLSFDISKISQVRGIGALIAHRTIPLKPLYRGGGQERGLRPGSESPELAKAFAAALRAAALYREHFCISARQNRTQLVQVITNTIPNVLINEGHLQAPNILNLSFLAPPSHGFGGTPRDTDYLVALFDEAGFAVSTRSACETDSEEGSRAVFALTGDKERARATLRISWSSSIRSRELTRFAKSLARSIALLAVSSSNR